MKRHEGKTMLVTGAAGAIGFATCRILAQEGARVMLVDIVEDRLQTRTAELKQAGHDVVAFHADCADEAQVKAYAQAALDAFGHVDGFFNNAGIEGVLSPTDEYPVDEFDHVLVGAASLIDRSDVQRCQIVDVLRDAEWRLG